MHTTNNREVHESKHINLAANNITITLVHRKTRQVTFLVKLKKMKYKQNTLILSTVTKCALNILLKKFFSFFNSFY